MPVSFISLARNRRRRSITPFVSTLASSAHRAQRTAMRGLDVASSFRPLAESIVKAPTPASKVTLPSTTADAAPTTGDGTSSMLSSLLQSTGQSSAIPQALSSAQLLGGTSLTRTGRRGGGMRTVNAREAAGGRAAVGGAERALHWAKSKLGKHEVGAANVGPLPSRLNRSFGMSGQPWCAMFTSFAVTHGGAPSSARTASVAQVRAKAHAKQGYKGFVNPGHARAGDLVLFGNSHIAMVTKAKGGRIHYIGGNQSNAVTRGTTSAGFGVSIVRPQYRGKHGGKRR